MKRPTAYVRIALLAALPFCFWVLLAKLKQVGLGGYTSQWSGWYQADMLDVLISTMRTWIGKLAASWRDGFVGDVGGTPLPVLAAAVGILGLIGWLDRLRRLKYDALYFLCYLAMLFAWPHPEEASRYGFVLLPFLVAYPVMFLQCVRENLKYGAAVIPSAVAFLSVCIAMTIPSLVVNVQRYFQLMPDEFKNAPRMAGWYSDDGMTSQYLTRFHLKVFNHLKTLGDFVPAEECIFSAKAHVTALHSHRIGVSTPDNTVDDVDFARAIGRCKYAYVVNLSFTRRPGLYPLRRLASRARIISATSMDEGYKKHIVGALIEILPLPCGEPSVR